MRKILRNISLAALLTALLFAWCAPTQTVKETTSVEPTEEQRREAEQYYSIGFEYYKQGNYDEAIKNFDIAIEKHPEFYAAYIALAKAFRGKADITTTEKYYNKAKSIDPKDPRAYEGLGALYAELKRFGEAMGEYESGLRIDSTSVNLLNGLAYVYKEMGQYQKAIDYYNKSLRYEKDNLSTQYAIADVYIQMNKHKEAIQYLKDIIVLKPNNMDVVKKLAETLLELKRYGEAATEFTKLIGNEPDNYYYHMKLGEAYRKQKSYKAAESELMTAQRLAPERALPLYALVDLYIDWGKFSTAEEYARKALKVEPDNLYAYLLLGDIYERRGWNARNQWMQNKSTKNCSVLNTAISNFRSATSYYAKAKPDLQCSQYANNEIKRCTNWLEELEEDKWFYCKEGS
jgi:tetratricopeptide (TPR) repeat protein